MPLYAANHLGELYRRPSSVPLLKIEQRQIFSAQE
jgi:hypothetical protein